MKNDIPLVLTKKQALILLGINQGLPKYNISPMPMGKKMCDAINKALGDETKTPRASQLRPERPRGGNK